LPDESRSSSRAGWPSVSVIIPTRDRPRLLDEALASVAAQERRGDVEVIVVNDRGASVETVISAWEDVMAVRLVEVDRRSGPAAARNIGIDRSHGEYLAFLDDDDLFLPGHLDAGCEPLERGQADFVYLGAIVADQRLHGRPPDLAPYRLKAYPYDQRMLMVANFLHTGSVIVRNFRNAPVRFSEELDVCEDWDLWLALTITLGYRVQFVDQITSVYHQVPEVAGLVASAQLVSPSRFAVARDYIQAKWPARDPLVTGYREWMNALERSRSELIATNRRMPNLLFDEILGSLHERISRDQPADSADISQFFVHEGPGRDR
jgi:glycosyltransferase involved in cell wall biosynthesis